MAVRARGERADEVFLAGLARDRDDLVVLDVGAEADHEVGEAGKGGVIHALNLAAGGRGADALPFPAPRRGAGVVERGGLENRCGLFGPPRVRIPPPPPQTASASAATPTVVRVRAKCAR